MTPHAFTPTPDDPTGDRTAPLALFAEPRWTGNRGAGRWVPDTAAANAMPEPVPEARPEPAWWRPIVNGLWHAWRAHELCDGWTLGDLADEMADQLWAESRRLTAATEELVQVPDAAVAAVARIRRGE